MVAESNCSITIWVKLLVVAKELRMDPIPDNNTFNVTIIFDIIGQEIPTQEYSFILEATR